MSESLGHDQRNSGDGAISRRKFLEMVGMTGAAIGVGVGIGGVLAACGSDTDQTVSTSGASTTTAGAITTTADSATTTVQAGAEMGEKITCGYVVPITGSKAEAGAAAKWQTDWYNKNVWKDGLVMGDGKKHKIDCILMDMQSDSNRAATVTGDLITNNGAVLVGASASAVNVVPVRDMAEALGCPCVTYDCPGDAWNEGQPEGGFKWCWHTWWIFRDMVANYLAMWQLVPTNKVIGGLWPNEAEGIAFSKGLPDAFTHAGLKYIDVGLYNPGADDYSAIIDDFKKAGCELIVGVPGTGDFANFWKQSVQQGYRPKIATMAAALLFPETAEALGDLADGMSVECWFHPTFPYGSDVTGLTGQQMADEFEKDLNRQWSQPVCFTGQYDLFTDILTRAKDPTNKESVVEAIKQTKVNTIGGLVDFTVNPEPYSGWWNYSTKPICGGQWVSGKGKFKYDLEIMVSATTPEIKPTAIMKEVQYPN